MMLRSSRANTHSVNKWTFSSVFVCAVLLFTAVWSGAGSIKVSWDPEWVIHGAVVPVHVQSPLKLAAAEAVIGKERFPLIRGDNGRYIALVGVDRKQGGPGLSVEFNLFPAKGGPPYRIRADLTIRETGEKAGQQSLSLPTGMVDFSQKRLKQIRQDNATLSDALSTRIPRRFWKEGFIMPVSGRITTRFGTRRILNGKPRSPHNGVDIAGNKGTPVKASNRGRVLLVDSFYLSGNTIVVDHGWGVSTIYAHLDSTAVSEGQEVERGQPIGTVGSTGRATGPHLHFGALIRGVKVDPLQLIEATRDFKPVISKEF